MFKGNQYTKKPSKSTAALGEVVNSEHSQQQGPSAETPKQCVGDHSCYIVLFSR